MYTTTLLSIVAIMTIVLVFVVEFVVLFREILKNKQTTILINYLIFNEAVLLMMYVRIHESFFTEEIVIAEIFIKGGYLLFFIVICFMAYPFIDWFSAKLKSGREKGYT